MASSPPDRHEEDAAAGREPVCCMCGDHGLPRELFRCKSCRVRLQHKYCSDLYPRATAYRRCNWCLVGNPPHQPAQGAAGTAVHATAANAGNGGNKPAAETKRKAATVSDEERHHRRHEGCSPRVRPPAGELGYPVKKRQRIKADDDGRAPPDDGRVREMSCSNGSSNAGGGESKEVMRAGNKLRVKVRRYKLLAEVISC